LRRVAGGALEHEEIAVVGEQKLAVVSEIIFDLLSLCDRGQMLGGRFDLDDTTSRGEAEKRSFLVGVFELVRGEKAAVRKAGAAVPELDDAADFGLQRVADGVEQFDQNGVARGLLGRGAAVVYFTQFGQIAFKQIHRRQALTMRARKRRDPQSPGL